jgi:hypothetical protein
LQLHYGTPLDGSAAGFAARLYAFDAEQAGAIDGRSEGL